MRKIFGFIFLIISIAIIVSGSILLLEEKRYIIKFTNVENTTEFEIVEGGYVQVPEVPLKKGYRFIGWYYKGNLFDFNKPVMENIELEARWEKIEIVT